MGKLCLQEKKLNLISMNHKRFINALFKTMLFFATFHMILLTILFVLSFKLSYLNIFSVTGLSLIFPGIENGLVSFIISGIIVSVAYSVFYAKQKH